MKKLLITSLFFMSLYASYCQSNNYQLPKIVKSSPEAQNFLRYGEIPVDVSTGVPNINVPVHVLKSRKLQFPISASYHASGIKVSDRASNIGLGWVLNIAGVLGITSLSNQGAEGQAPTYKTAQSFNDAKANAGADGSPAWQSFINMMLLEEQGRDWQSERYSFQLPNGLSGIFRYDFLTDELMKLPYGSYTVDKILGNYPGLPNTGLVGFRITDDKGDKYLFGYPPGGTFNNYRTTMDLLQIISADNTDTIRFVYKSGVGNLYDLAAFGSLLDLGDDVIANPSNGLPSYTPYATASQVTNRNTTIDRILDSIIASSTILKIVSIADRPDMQFYNVGGYRYERLEVYDRFTGQMLNEIKFNQSYFGSQANGNRRLRLDSIAIKGSAGPAYQTFKFDYENSVQLPPVPEDDPTAHPLFSEDFWGYFNNSSSYSKVPYQWIPSTFFSPYTGQSVNMPYASSTDRNPNHSYAKAAMIKSITYPTGGKTVFEFEPNYAANAYSFPNQTTSAGAVGGFRVYKIKNYTDLNTLAETKTYEYSPGWTRTISSDLFSYQQRSFKTVSTCIVLASGGCSQQPNYATSVPHTIFTSTPFLPLTYDHGPPVFYEKVTEYIGDPVNNTGKIEYNYLFPEATVYASSDHPRFNNVYEEDKGNYIPLLSNKVVYRRDAGQYFPVQRTLNSYNKAKQKYYSTGLHLVHTSSYPSQELGQDHYGYVINGTLNGGYFDNYFSTLGVNNYWIVFDLHANPAVELLTGSTDIYYGLDTTKKLITNTIIKYDTLTHLLPIEKLVTNSKGELIKSVFKYPVNNAGTAVYDSMVARNIISPAIEQITTNTTLNKELSKSKENYSFWQGNTIIQPSSIQKSLLANALETEATINDYDNKGNIKQVTGKDGIIISYIWGYNQQYPVAKVVNRTYSDAVSQSAVDMAILNAPANETVLRIELNKFRNLSNAFATTYTYKSLIGITSETDPNGKTIYYEYDNFNRLTLIRDKDNNILKKICYNYAGQIENCLTPCPPNSSPIWQNTGNMRCQLNGSSQYTGYTEYEQANINTCVTVLPQWVVQGGVNTSVCTPPGYGVSLTSTLSNAATGYTATYYNTVTGYTYVRPVTAATGLQPLGNIPAGTYNLTIARTTGIPIYADFKSGCNKFIVSGTSASFYNISVSATTCNSITITLGN